MVKTSVEPLLDQFDKAGGYQVVVVHGVGVITNRGGVAHHHKYVAYILCMRCQQVALHTQQIAPACGEVQGGFNAHLTLDQVAHSPGAHTHTRHGAIGHVDDICTGFSQQAGTGQQLLGQQPAWRVHLDCDDKFSLAQFLRQLGGWHLRDLCLRGFSIGHFQPGAFKFMGVGALYGQGHGVDMLGGGSAAAADNAGTFAPEGEGIIAKVFRASRVHDAPFHLLRPTCVGHNGERTLRHGFAHAFE
ncbi:hypothetical protein SDC9_95090 [bioreactor metagenome]|uniref:Uncharacterized protein n=1 Tax=bioreactor metagenome TaxID=1076179 RepID=A0A645A5Y5_9ZZZZ